MKINIESIDSIIDFLKKEDRIINEAKEEGCKRLTLLTDIANTQAQSFYEKKGFNKMVMTPYKLMLD